MPSGWYWSPIRLCLVCGGSGDPQCTTLTILALLVSEGTAALVAIAISEASGVLEAQRARWAGSDLGVVAAHLWPPIQLLVRFRGLDNLQFTRSWHNL